MEHPYFRQHITEVVWDASAYSKSLGRNAGNYDHVCRKFSRRKYLRERVDDHTHDLNRLLQHCERANGKAAPEDFTMQIAGRKINLYSGVHAYSKRWLDQEHIIGCSAAISTFSHALNKDRLPKVRKITYTDFRYLARPGEPYVALCRRLFGDVIEPNNLFLEAESGVMELMPVLMMLRDLFHLGDASKDRSGQTARVAKQMDPVLGMRGLKHLRLPVRIPLSDALEGEFQADKALPKSTIKTLLTGSTATLQRLELIAHEDPIFNDDDGEKAAKQAHAFFTSLLDGVQFPHLHYLELRYWQLKNSGALKQFLKRHAATLQEVRLFRCRVMEDPKLLAKWVGNNLSLVGADIDLESGNGFEDEGSRRTTALSGWWRGDDDDDDDEDEDMDDEHEDDDGVYPDLNPTATLAEQITLPPKSSPDAAAKLEAETLWLGGRGRAHNSIRPPSTPQLRLPTDLALFEGAAPNPPPIGDQDARAPPGFGPPPGMFPPGMFPPGQMPLPRFGY